MRHRAVILLAAVAAVPALAQWPVVEPVSAEDCEREPELCETVDPDDAPGEEVPDSAVPDDAIRPPGLLAEVAAPEPGNVATPPVIGGMVRTDEMFTPPPPADPAAPGGAADGARAGQAFVRSTGGRRAQPGEARWQAQIYQPWGMERFAAAGMADGRPLWQLQHICGGVLIAQGWLLTAAHCLANADGDRRPGYRVRLGVIDFSRDDGWTYMIDRVVRYPLYRDPAPGAPPRTRFDLALVRFVRDGATRAGDPPPELAEPIALDTQPPPPEGELVQATGWGVMAGQRPTAVMMLVKMDVVAEQRCAELWGTPPNPYVICAGREGVQTCQGDSGGPLVNLRGAPRLIGIVSYNLRECRGDARRPGVYTRVAMPEYLNWIRQVTRETAPAARR